MNLGGLIRVKTGCVTCRIRRIKCDEGKPACNKCLSTGRTCDGYIGGSVSRKTSKTPSGSHAVAPAQGLDRRPRSSHFETDKVRLSFEFFTLRTLAATGDLLGLSFWQQLVPQTALCEPAVMHIALALGFLHEQIAKPDDSVSQDCKRLALQQYGKAIANARRLIANTDPKNSTLALVSCVLFVCFENQVGNYNAAHVHLRAGLAIVSRSLSSESTLGRPQVGSTTDMISAALCRLDFQARTFVDTTAPYPYSREDLATLDVSASNLSYFASGDDAQRRLITVLRKIIGTASLLFSALVQPNPDAAAIASLQATKTQCHSDLARWHTAFEVLRTAALPTLTSKATCTYRLLLMYHKIGALLLSAGTSGRETAWDAHVAEFADLVTDARVIHLRPGSDAKVSAGSVSFELGTVIPLFVVAIKCRDPRVRRSAIALLLDMDRWEGMWHSVGSAGAAEIVVRIEEERTCRLTGLERVMSAEEIPENARVIEVIPTAQPEFRKVSIKVLIHDAEDLEGPWIMRDEDVTY
ncbi:hypothetical protein LTR66_000821 [Elasticomyces elasticus]|nr:hypothetical protein LTR66_000821 [Elasticomyces elasticus]